jgi:hypothetical protein
MTLPNPYRFVACKRPDFHGEACYHIYDQYGEHVSTMVWSSFQGQWHCHWHRHDQWSTPYRSWQRAIDEVEGVL